MVTVRRANSLDADRLVALLACFAAEMSQHRAGHGLPASEDAIRRGVTAILRGEERYNQYLLAELPGQAPIGQLLVSAEWDDISGTQTWWLRRLYVVPAHRHQGIALALFEAARELARSTGEVSRFRGHVHLSNENSKRLLMKYGFKSLNGAVYELEL